MPDNAVVDTSVLIAFSKIGLLDLLGKSYDEVFIPESVVVEFGNRERLPEDCFTIVNVDSGLSHGFIEEFGIGKGEASVIALALSNEIGDVILNEKTGRAFNKKEYGRILIDDLKARKIAKRMGLKVSGTIGVLLKAEVSGINDKALSKTEKLKDHGFYVSDKLLREIIRGEGQ